MRASAAVLAHRAGLRDLWYPAPALPMVHSRSAWNLAGREDARGSH